MMPFVVKPAQLSSTAVDVLAHFLRLIDIPTNRKCASSSMCEMNASFFEISL